MEVYRLISASVAFIENEIDRELDQELERDYQQKLRTHQEIVERIAEYEAKRHEIFEKLFNAETQYHLRQHARVEREQAILEDKTNHTSSWNVAKKAKLSRKKKDLETRRAGLDFDIELQIEIIQTRLAGTKRGRTNADALKEQLNDLKEIRQRQADLKAFDSSTTRPMPPPLDKPVRVVYRRSPALMKYPINLSDKINALLSSLAQLRDDIGFSFAAVSSKVNGRAVPYLSSNWLDHLRHSRICQASDERDRVYAFLGLASKGYGVKPDYSMKNTVIHVLINTARAIIVYQKDLGILEHASQGRASHGHEIPTWVPDWTSPEVDCGIRDFADSYLQDHPLSSAAQYLGNEIPAKFRVHPANESNVDLRARGFWLTTLDNTVTPVDKYPSLQSFSTTRSAHKYRVVTSNSTRWGDQAWLLYGASMPVILRPEFDSKDTYSFVSQALVVQQDNTVVIFMSDAFLRMAEQNECATDIWLV